ncbi:MAG: PAS domain-containing protein [Alphaproteobacteria bacterium]|nr:PAS domain-containing protein [Alphaproteobacteria bacterium]
MVEAVAKLLRRADTMPVDLGAALNALPTPVLVVEADRRISYVNQAAEQFLESGASFLTKLRLDELVRADHPIFALIDQVRAAGSSVSEYGVTIEAPRIGQHQVTVEASTMPERPGATVVMLHRRSIAQKIDRQLTHRNAARSVTAMAAMLAHEVKNPLSGIRGAAQLLEQGGKPEDRELTRLIIDETDRICALVDRMEVFSDQRPIERQPVNIHEVLERVRRVAQNGFARHIRFVERYDPSLPPALGNRDRLIQVFLNLVKNAAEAAPQAGGEIVLATAYQHGIRLAVPGSDARTHLPLVVSVQDNGEGIPEDLRAHLFDPFVTTKVNGTGLGLALVAKIVGDHGSVIEFDSQPRRTVFRVMLPVHSGSEA